MSEKITLQDIIELLAEKHQMTKKDAEIFVRGMFELIEEALATEKYVKVKGLGTFKLTEVDSRKSVDINTGERFEIQGHTKISFTPDSSMKELINKPFAHFETVILNENTQLEDTEIGVEGEEEEEGKEESVEETITQSVEQPILREEIMTTDAEEAEAAGKERKDGKEQEEKNLGLTETVTYPPSFSTQEVTEEVRVIEEQVEEAVEAVEGTSVFLHQEAIEAEISEEEKNKETVNTPQEESEEKDSVQEETLIDIETPPVEKTEVVTMMKDDGTLSEIDTAIDTSGGQEEEQDSSQPENTEDVTMQIGDANKKSGTFWGIIIVVILILCIAGGIYWYLKTDDNEKSAQQVVPAATTASAQSKKEELVQPSDSLTPTKDTANILPPDTLPKEATVSQSQQVSSTTTSGNKDIAKVSLADTVEYDITGTKTNYTLQEGESLIKVAVKFYGSKKLWPYIVKHNKDIIKNADRVPIGTTLRIPELVPKKQ